MFFFLFVTFQKISLDNLKKNARDMIKMTATNIKKEKFSAQKLTKSEKTALVN